MITIIPAIDIIDGKCVRLTKGDYSLKKVYGEDPLEIARRFEDCGMRFLHLVDLDGARAKHPVNLKVLEKISACTSLKTEFGGGVKSRQALTSVFDAGASRIICGSIACTEPDSFADWIKEFGGERVVLGADVKDGLAAVNGWEAKSDNRVEDLLGKFLPAGLRTAVVTDVAKDGMLAGPSLDLYRGLMDMFPEIELVASGGVCSIADIEAIEKAGVPAVIVGKAIYEGRISLKDLSIIL